MKMQLRERIRALRKARKSDLERWAKPESVAKAWGSLRYRLVAKAVPAGARVIDLGCGNQELAKWLSPHAAYTPADLVLRTPDTILIELNEGLWPVGRWDCLCAVGVLEYVFDVADFFTRATQLADRIIVTYHSSIQPEDDATREGRLEAGWLSDFTPGQIMASATAAGLIPVQIAKFGSSDSDRFWQHLYVFEIPRPHPRP